MNTLKVGYTLKAHCFTSQIVSQMWTVTKYAEFFVDAPNGALLGKIVSEKLGSILSTYIPWTSTTIKRSLGRYYFG